MNPKPLDLPVGSVMTFTLSVFPEEDRSQINIREEKRRLSQATTTAEYFTVFVEEFLQMLIVHVVSEVFDVDIGEFLGFGTEFRFPLFA